MVLFQAGHVTASRFKAAVHTDPSQPFQLLQLCYPKSVRFTTKATRWDCEHEKTAREAYFKVISSDHTNLIVSDRGLVIHPNYPQLGAIPDGYVNCSCCGPGVIEVKCPFSCSNKSFLEPPMTQTFV